MEWLDGRTGGIGTGEGLIQKVGEGAKDKRYLARLPELSKCIKLQRREGATLSETLREIWDGEKYTTPNLKANALSAEGYTVSAIGDITEVVLAKMFGKGTEGEDGWANRFLWRIVGDLRDIPKGGNLKVLDAFLPPLGEGHRLREVRRRNEAGHRSRYAVRYRVWRVEAKRQVVKDTDRARPYVMRFAMLYAVADLSSVIRKTHLEAGLAIWGYCLESARQLFSIPETKETSSHLELRIWKLIDGKPEGVSRSDIRTALGTKVKASDIDEALASIREKKLAHCVEVKTGGKPAHVWVKGEVKEESTGEGRIDHPDEGETFVWGEDEDEKKPTKMKVDVEALHHDDKHGLAGPPQRHSWGEVIGTEEVSDEEAEAFYRGLRSL
jgi:hypothetical protein